MVDMGCTFHIIFDYFNEAFESAKNPKETDTQSGNGMVPMAIMKGMCHGAWRFQMQRTLVKKQIG